MLFGCLRVQFIRTGLGRMIMKLRLSLIKNQYLSNSLVEVVFLFLDLSALVEDIYEVIDSKVEFHSVRFVYIFQQYLRFCHILEK